MTERPEDRLQHEKVARKNALVSIARELCVFHLDDEGDETDIFAAEYPIAIAGLDFTLLVAKYYDNTLITLKSTMPLETDGSVISTVSRRYFDAGDPAAPLENLDDIPLPNSEELQRAQEFFVAMKDNHTMNELQEELTNPRYTPEELVDVHTHVILERKLPKTRGYSEWRSKDDTPIEELALKQDYILRAESLLRDILPISDYLQRPTPAELHYLIARMHELRDLGEFASATPPNLSDIEII